MRRYLVKTIITSTVALALAPSSFAQNINGQFSEQNLPEKTAQKSQIINNNNSNPAPAIGGLKNSIEELFLNQKVSSLMFDDEENSNIDRAIDAFRNRELNGLEAGSTGGEGNEDGDFRQYERNEKSYIYLGSIIYLTPKDWVVWINNQKITSFTNYKTNELYVRSVEKDKVRLLWTLSISKWKILSGKNSEDFAPKLNEHNQVEVEFELRPNQTFILVANKVVEGRAASFIKKDETEKNSKSSKKSDASKTAENTAAASETTPALPKASSN